MGKFNPINEAGFIEDPNDIGNEDNIHIQIIFTNAAGNEQQSHILSIHNGWSGTLSTTLATTRDHKQLASYLMAKWGAQYDDYNGAPALHIQEFNPFKGPNGELTVRESHYKDGARVKEAEEEFAL